LDRRDVGGAIETGKPGECHPSTILEQGKP
jgi:hypothetical protein